jgi:hypothetical protein
MITGVDFENMDDVLTNIKFSESRHHRNTDQFEKFDFYTFQAEGDILPGVNESMTVRTASLAFIFDADGSNYQQKIFFGESHDSDARRWLYDQINEYRYRR